MGCPARGPTTTLAPEQQRQQQQQANTTKCNAGWLLPVFRKKTQRKRPSVRPSVASNTSTTAAQQQQG
jgi:hypothetical protein